MCLSGFNDCFFVIFDPIQNGDLDLSSSPFARLGINYFPIPPIIIITVIKGLFGCMVDVAVVGLEDGGW